MWDTIASCKCRQKSTLLFLPCTSFFFFPNRFTNILAPDKKHHGQFQVSTFFICMYTEASDLKQ